MSQLPKHIRLFHNAWVDYITSFIKLRLSFNAWYKKEFEHENPQVVSDKEAIKKCKTYQKVIWCFNNLIKSTNPEEWKRFHECLVEMFRIKCEGNFPILDKKWNDAFNYYGQSEIRFGSFKPKIDYTIYKNFHNDLYIENGREDLLIQATFDIIYWLRCKLFHWDFDIENKDFEKMIFYAHSILHILLEKIIF